MTVGRHLLPVGLQELGAEAMLERVERAATSARGGLGTEAAYLEGVAEGLRMFLPDVLEPDECYREHTDECVECEAFEDGHDDVHAALNRATEYLEAIAKLKGSPPEVELLEAIRGWLEG